MPDSVQTFGCERCLLEGDIGGSVGHNRICFFVGHRPIASSIGLFLEDSAPIDWHIFICASFGLCGWGDAPRQVKSEFA